MTFAHKAMKSIPLDLWNSRLAHTSIFRLETLVTGVQLGPDSYHFEYIFCDPL